MPETTTQKPKPQVKLTGRDGNVFSLGGICGRALKDAGYDRAEIDRFYREITATSDYDAALRVMMKWCEVE